jgi:hypothetical protein
MTVTMKMNEHDNRTSSELRDQKFSGLRTNDLASRFEIWIAGSIEKTLSYQRFWEEPHSLETVYCEAFGLKEITMSGAVEEAVREITGRKKKIEELGQTDEGKRLLDEH